MKRSTHTLSLARTDLGGERPGLPRIAFSLGLALFLLLLPPTFAGVSEEGIGRDETPANEIGWTYGLTVSAAVLWGQRATFEPPWPGTDPLPQEAALGIEDELGIGHGSLAAWLDYAFTERSRFRLQLSRRQMGDSVITDAGEEIDLDWLFYEIRIGRTTTIRAGRTPIPFGLDNERRDDPTQLPFFRPAFLFYREGDFITETVDGLRLRHRFFPDHPWGASIAVYSGEWELFEIAGEVNRIASSGPLSNTVAKSKHEGYGGALWFHLPFAVVGAGGQRSDSTGSRFSHLPGQETRWKHEFVSLRLRRGPYSFTAEGRTAEAPVDFLSESIGLGSELKARGFSSLVEIASWYFRLGWRSDNDRWGVSLQAERSSIEQCAQPPCVSLDPPPPGQSFPVGISAPHVERRGEDIGAALNYRARDNLVLRAEWHQLHGQALKPAFHPSLGGLNQTRRDPTRKGQYVLLSVAWSL